MMKKILYTACLPLLLLLSCVKDRSTERPDNGEGIQTTLTLRVTGGAATRAMNAAAENDIQHIDILVFKKAAADNPQDAMFDYIAQTTLVGTADGDQTKKNFRVTLRQSDGSDDLQKLVVLANCRSIVESASLTGKTYAQVADALTIANAARWESGGIAQPEYDPFPMWGEQPDFRQLSAPSSVPASIDLFRALAAIDVKVAESQQSDFSLTEVHLCNPATKAALIPAAANWNATDREAVAPTTPAGGYALSAAPFAYTAMTTAGKSLLNAIYTFEAPKSAGNSATTETCLVVKGSYKGEAGYYRIDFFGKDNAGEITDDYLPLLRNFRYTVSIDGVSGRGYPTLTQALTASFTDLTATTSVWDDGNMGRVVWDGSNYLAVTTDEYEIDDLAQTITNIKAATNYSGGWIVSVALDENDNEQPGTAWLTTSSTGSGDENPHEIVMNVAENTTRLRTAIVTVTAGRLKQEIAITQRLNQLLSLDVGDVEVVFSAAAPQLFQLPIEWEPAATPLKVELIDAGTVAAGAYSQLDGYTQGIAFPASAAADHLVSGGGDYADADSDASNGGMLQLKILPNAATLAAFAERRSILKITSDNGAETITKTVLLRQFDYRVAASGMHATYQLGTTYSFTVKANAKWEMSATGDVTILSAAAGDANTSGVTFSFRTGTTDGTVPVLTFSLTNYPSVQHQVSIPMKKLEPNCYIVKPGNSQVIPISKVFEIWKTDADLYDAARGGDPAAMTSAAGAYSVELLWQDAQGLIPVQPGNLAVDVSAKMGSFTVETSAGKEGNAVVVLKENGVIRWSWHIWVCDFDPDQNTGYNPRNGYTIMDRNIGATTNFAPVDDDDVRSFGLLYQHGRKDPLPGARRTRTANSSYDSKYIYDFNNALLTEGATNNDHEAGAGVIRKETTADRNLANSIYEPLTYFWGDPASSTSLDWYTTAASISRSDLWRTSIGLKAAYDPCPDGWEVPANFLFDYIEPGTFEARRGVQLSVGFFPATGFRATVHTVGSASQGYMSNAGLIIYLWRSSGGTTGNMASYSSADIITSSAFAKARACPVRCVKTQ